MAETKKREGGYYWCKADGHWEILLWSSGYEKWFVPAHTETLDDSDFDEIDERQIVRE